MQTMIWFFLGGIGVGMFISYLIDQFYAGLQERFGWTRIVQSYFSPNGGCAKAIVAEIETARREVLVQAYSFTHKDIAKALIAASKRGVNVCVLLDRSNEKEMHTELGNLSEEGLEVWIDAHHAIAHNKVMIIDKRTLITGSFNFTHQAEHENAENLLIIRNEPALVESYYTHFHNHKDHCNKPGEVHLSPSAHNNRYQRAVA